MSSLYVRKLVETWVADPVITVPFYPTVNQEQNPQDDTWFTLEFGSTSREVMTFCQGEQLEEGEIEIIVFGLPGRGYDDVLQAAEAVADALMAMTDPNGKLVLTGRSAPYEYSGGSAQREYAASIYLDYQYYV